MTDPRTLLRDARLYLCADSRSRQGDLPDFLDAILGAGVDIIQLREKGLEAQQEIRLLETFAEAADRHGKLFAVNDRADIAAAVHAPILHLGQNDLPVSVAPGDPRRRTRHWPLHPHPQSIHRCRSRTRG